MKDMRFNYGSSVFNLEIFQPKDNHDHETDNYNLIGYALSVIRL